MQVVKIWLLVLFVAAAVLGVLAVTDILVGQDLRDATRITVLVLLILATTHYAWTVVRGRANPADHTDRPVP